MIAGSLSRRHTQASRRHKKARGTTRWRAASSLREGYLNVVAGGPFFCALLAIVAAVTATLITADLATVHRIVARESAFLRAGGDLLVVQRANDHIDARVCARVNAVAGVRTAFALSADVDGAVLAGRPDSHQTLAYATEGILRLYGLPYPGADGVIISKSIAERWQWRPGAVLAFTPSSGTARPLPTRPLRVAAIADLAKLGDAESTAILLLQPARGNADFCFVQIRPQDREILRSVLPAVFGDRAEARIQVSDVLPPAGQGGDPASEFRNRLTSDVSLMAGALIGLLWGVVTWMRRGRSALYASLGVPYAGGVLIRWTEGALVIGLGVLWGTTLAIAVATAVTDAAASQAIDLGVRHGLVAMTVALAMVALTGLWQPATLAALKERQ
ncbi:MAG: hypothetical protein K6T28_00755 [Acidothermus sp.]|nr:hypothetical protein [Acidothermus sp.]